MDKAKRDLESLVNSQKEQLLRYETRLKDVVTAYKGLLKEKEALEASFSALTPGKEKVDNTKHSETTNNAPQQPGQLSDGSLQLQIATLMNSLATLSAEKSRMEASFQADKKQLRIDISQKDKQIKELQEKIKEAKEKNAVDVESVKSKVIVERHEREKEANNHMVMIRELQKLYADERHLKENLEMQLNDLKSQFSTTGYNDSKIRELSIELAHAKEKIKQLEDKKSTFACDSSNTILNQLQGEMQHLKQQHAIAIKSEQKRAHVAEERNKKLAALHEDRVANLEARLAELSNTVGSYDRLRHQDQENIQKLKDKIIQLALVEDEDANLSKPKHNQKVKDLGALVDEILQLKKVLLVENARSPNPFDISQIFNTGTDHSQCMEDLNKIQSDLEDTRKENEDLKESCDVQKSHIKTLQEKVKVLNRNIDEQEIELKSLAEKISIIMKTEKNKCKTIVNGIENDCRGKVSALEHQLQKQRDRSLQLLEEKENEIKALKTSFEIFMPQVGNQVVEEETHNQSRKISSSHLNTVLNVNAASSNSINDNCPMLHYVNELARKDVEISAIRKAKHLIESALRQALQDKVTAQEDLNDKIMRLEDEVDRLERCKTREGANLEYLKNVVVKFFLSSKDIEGKRHMINAIGAVLQFNPSEMKEINNLFHKK